jgi:hypothetical protein
MFRIGGQPNKLTTEVKEKLQLLIDDLITSLNVNEKTLTSVLRCFK